MLGMRTWVECLVAGMLALAASGCGDDAAAGGSSPGDGGSDAGVDGGDPPADAGGGACLADDDRAIVTGRSGTDVDAELQSCVKALLTSGKGPSDADFADRISDCLETETGLSAGCSDCHAAFADCSADQCLAACIADPSAQQCIDCRCGKSAAMDCIGAFVECSGLPDDTCS